MILDGPDALSVALRAVSFTLLLNAAGIPIFIAAFGRLTPNSLPDIRKLGRQLTMGALVLVAAHQALEGARMAGEMSGIVAPAMQKMALLSSAGMAFAMRIAGLMLVAMGLRTTAPQSGHATPAAAAAGGPLRATNPTGAHLQSAPAATAGAPADAHASSPASASVAAHADSGASAPRHVASPIALLGTLLTITSFTMVGHTTTTPHRLAAAALITVHLLVVAFWIGSLWPLYMAATKDSPAQVIDKFSKTAFAVVPLILLAGIGLAALLLPGLAAFKQPYGQLLLAKVIGFAVLMGMASLNKWQFGPACAEGNTAAFKRTVVLEYVLIGAVLAITAAMTTFYSPDP